MAPEELCLLFCAVCCNKFDVVERRPKILACGHTYCLLCLERTTSRVCPTCRRPFEEAPQSLSDNYQLFQFLVDGPSNVSGRFTVSQRPSFWCRDGRTFAADACVDEKHDMVSLSKLHSECSKSAHEARRVVAALEGLSSQVQAALDSWRGTLQRLESAGQALVSRAWPGDSESLQDQLVAAQQDLSRDLARDGARVLEASSQCLASLELEDHGRAEASPPEQTIDCDRHLMPGDFNSLLDPRLDQVTSLKMSVSHLDWCEAVLRKVAGRLQRLYIADARSEHLEVIQGMSQLQVLTVVEPYSSLEQHLSLDGLPHLHALALLTARLPRVSYPPPPQGQGLRILIVDGMHPSEFKPLVRAYSATLKELWLCDHVYGDVSPDLGQDLAECGMAALRRLVLTAPCHKSKDKRTCAEGRERLGEALSSRVEVLCEQHDYLDRPELFGI